MIWTYLVLELVQTCSGNNSIPPTYGFTPGSKCHLPATRRLPFYHAVRNQARDGIKIEESTGMVDEASLLPLQLGGKTVGKVPHYLRLI